MITLVTMKTMEKKTGLDGAGAGVIAKAKVKIKVEVKVGVEVEVAAENLQSSQKCDFDDRCINQALIGAQKNVNFIHLL